MKPRLLFSALLLILATIVNAQVPQGFNYQALARDYEGAVLRNAELDVEIGILSDVEKDIYLWIEEHRLMTGSDGLLSLVVGMGTRTGGLFSEFNQINWSDGPRYIRTKIRFKGDWMEMGEARLWSVPYSLVADKAVMLQGNPVQVNGDAVYILNNVGIGNNEPGKSKLSVMGDDISAGEPLFEVKRRDGQTVFAVYNYGVNINIPVIEGEEVKGGFAIGGFDKASAQFKDYLLINHDSIRMYFDDNPDVKAVKGGFAIGGFHESKGAVKEYLRVTDDSTRINVNSGRKASKGGFAIGSFNETKQEGGAENFLNLSPENYFIGHEAGYKNETGKYNAFIGFTSGYSNISGSYNTFLGFESGISNNSGTNNVFMGVGSGYSNTLGNNNVFLGSRSGYSNTGGYNNIFIGNQAGENSTATTNSTFIGNAAGQNFNGDDNIFIGDRAGTSSYVPSEGFNTTVLGVDAGRNLQGSYNTILGSAAGFRAGSQGTGNNNVFIGFSAGYGTSPGLVSGNVCIGYYAGSGKSGSDKLYIANTNTKTLIYGDFATNQVAINGESAQSFAFYVNGTAGGTSPWNSPSDINLKRNVTTISGALDKVMNLRGVEFEWIDPVTYGSGKRVGFIAQETLGVLPQVVNTGNENLSMDYSSITSVLVEAIKEQQQIIGSLSSEIEELKSRQQEIEILRAELEAIKAMLVSGGK